MVESILICFIVILLVTVESSLQTSIIFDRSGAWWTVWLYKIGFLSIADVMIICVTIYVVWKALKNKSDLYLSPYVRLSLLAYSYLFIGFIYNGFVFPSWKNFFYDFKTVLYLTIPYFFMYFADSAKLRKLFSYKNIFILHSLSIFIDFVIVYSLGKSDRPTSLGFPSPTAFLSLSISLVGLIYIKGIKYKLMFLSFILLEITIATNLISLGSLTNAMYIPVYIMIAKFDLNKISRYIAVSCTLLLMNLLAVILISNPFNNQMLAAKAEGAYTRQIQLANALINSGENIPGILGKGLGSTWFEYIPIPDTDIFSVGTTDGEDPSVALSSPVKFIFNWVPPVLIHKWGLIGTLFLTYLISLYLDTALRENKLNYQSGKITDREQQWRSVIIMTSFIFIIDNFTYIGQVKLSLITSLLAFQVEHLPKEKIRASK